MKWLFCLAVSASYFLLSPQAYAIPHKYTVTGVSANADIIHFVDEGSIVKHSDTDTSVWITTVYNGAMATPAKKTAIMLAHFNCPEASYYIETAVIYDGDGMATSKGGKPTQPQHLVPESIFEPSYDLICNDERTRAYPLPEGLTVVETGDGLYEKLKDHVRK